MIIPTFNSANSIDSCLRSVRSQTYRDIEIIVVDGLSSDGTAEHASKYADAILRSQAGRSRARNLGARISKGEYLFFVDSDTELERDVIKECVEVSLTNACDAVVVNELAVGIGYWSRCMALEKRLYLQNSLVESPTFFSRKCFFSLNGFDDALEAGEDWDIGVRLTAAHSRVGRARSYVKHHEIEATPARMFLKKYYYGHTIKRYKKMNPNFARLQLSPYRFMNRNSVRMLAGSPQLSVGLAFLKSVELFGLWFGEVRAS